MKKVLSIILTLTMMLTMVIGTNAFADNVIVDGDNVAPLASSSLNLGNVAPGSSITGNVILAISRNGSKVNSFKPNETVIISFSNSSDANFSATIDGSDNTITMPTDWKSIGNNSLTADTVHSTVSVTVPANASIGVHTATLTYQASGKNWDGGDITRDGTVTVNYTVTKATPVVTTWPSASLTYGQYLSTSSFGGGTAVYNGQPVEGTYTYDALPTTLLSANTYSYNATFKPNDTTKYNPVYGKSSVTVNRANAAINVVGFSGAYDGQEHKATGTAKGVVGEDLNNLLHITGAYTDAPGGPASWTFDGNDNYNATSGTATIAIGKADAEVNVSGYKGVYDGNAHGATGTAKGILGEDLSSYLNLGATFVDVTKQFINWTFNADSSNTDYNAKSGSVEVNILKADADIKVIGFTGTYDGNPHYATGTAKGINGEDLSGLLHITGTYTDAPGGTATWTFDGDANYNAASGEVAIDIQKADADVKVEGYTDIYDGNEHGATGSATGVNGTDLSGQLNFGEKYANAPGGTAAWTFDGGRNYNNESGSVQIVINKANAAISVPDTTVTYDGDAHGATGTASGVKNEDLSGLLDLGAKFTDAPGGTATWIFAGNNNYKEATGTAKITINKANASFNVPAYTVTYDGNDHGATGTAAGVKNEDLSGLLDLGVKFIDVPGGTATWTFSGNNNYNEATGTVTITIEKANATIDVVGYEGTYDGKAHGATGTAKGVKEEVLTGLLELGAKFTDAPGGTATWMFAGNNNYKEASGTTAITINKANATIDVAGYAGTFDGKAHGATGTAKGVLNEDLGSLLSLGAQFTNVPGGTAEWIFAGNGNYYAKNGSASIAISKAATTTTLSNVVNVKLGTAVAATAIVTGAGDLKKAVDVIYTGIDGTVYGPTTVAPTKVGKYNASATFEGDVNYLGSSASKDFTITYNFTGFFQPVDMNGVINNVKAGSAVPIKFTLHGNMGLNVIEKGFPTVVSANFATNALSDDIETVVAAGSSSLSYDAATDTYTYVWKTDKTWVGSGKMFTLKLIDGSICTANFKFK